MTLLTEINYTQTELIEYANEHDIYKKGTKQKKLITENLTPNTKQEAWTSVTNSGAYNRYPLSKTCNNWIPVIWNPRDRSPIAWQIGARRTNRDQEFCYGKNLSIN